VCESVAFFPITGRATETQQETPEQAARRMAAEEEAHRAAIRAMGTMVTPDNFREWKAKFDAERAAVSGWFVWVLQRGARTFEQRKHFFGQWSPSLKWSARQ